MPSSNSLMCNSSHLLEWISMSRPSSRSLWASAKRRPTRYMYWEGCSYLCIFSLSLSLTFNPVSHHSVFPSQKQLHAYSLSLLPTTELSPLHSLTFEQQRNMQLSLKINQLWFHPLFFLILTISCFLWVHYKTHISGSDLVLLTFWCGAREGQRTGSFTLIDWETC